MDLETFEVTVPVPGPLFAAAGFALAYLLGVLVVDRRNRLYGGLWSSPRWWAWIWPATALLAVFLLCWSLVDRRR